MRCVSSPVANRPIKNLFLSDRKQAKLSPSEISHSFGKGVQKNKTNEMKIKEGKNIIGGRACRSPAPMRGQMCQFKGIRNCNIHPAAITVTDCWGLKEHEKLDTLQTAHFVGKLLYMYVSRILYSNILRLSSGSYQLRSVCFFYLFIYFIYVP